MPGRTAALVSPDRLLARRVAIRLEAWGIRVDDSAGRPFAKTVPGAFLTLVIGAAAGFRSGRNDGAAAHPLCAARARAIRRSPCTRAPSRSAPFCALSRPRPRWRRQPHSIMPNGTDGGRQAMASRRLQRLWPEEWTAPANWSRGSRRPSSRCRNSTRRRQRALSAFAAAHVAAAEALAAFREVKRLRQTRNPLWQGEAGETATRFFAELLAIRRCRASIARRRLRRSLPRRCCRARTCAERRRTSAPFIWGPFEARLQQADVMVLGSLNDGTWPEAAEPGAWLNRPMRRELGLPSPEEEIGYAAHDFVSLARGQDRLSDARRKGRRRADRAVALADAADGAAQGPGARERSRARSAVARLGARTRPDQASRLKSRRRRRRPPSCLRPRKLSVTEIERWISNPYAIFARRILKLEPLPPLGASPRCEAARRPRA